jgi:hypothetical protein
MCTNYEHGYDAFEHLCSVMCISPETTVAVLTAFFDEGGTDSSKPAVAVGCYVSTKELWDEFIQSWAKLRDEQHVEYFRRTDQESFWLHPETADWNKERRTRVFQAQHLLIRKFTLKGFGCTVTKEDYDAEVRGEDRNALGTLYEFCLRHCLADITHWLETRPLSDEILYVIESGAEGEGHLKHAFKVFEHDAELKRLHRIKDANSFAFLPKSKAIPLQAADALAYEVAKEAENRFGVIRRPTRLSFLDLYRPDTDRIHWWPREVLARAVAEVHSDKFRA